MLCEYVHKIVRFVSTLVPIFAFLTNTLKKSQYMLTVFRKIVRQYVCYFRIFSQVNLLRILHI
jgi:hypothetical protein